jgi:guanylate kinase
MSFENQTLNSPGPVIIVTAPSGSGKTTLVKFLLAEFPQLNFSISATTRARRPMEIDGKDYHFISIDQFHAFKNQGLFVEWEEVYPGQYYGTLLSELSKIWEKGNIVLFDVDVQGALHLKQKFKQHALTIFLRVPSLDILEERLKKRSTESPENYQNRILKAKLESGFADSFDHILINDNLIDAQKQIKELVAHFLIRLNNTWKHPATNP